MRALQILLILILLLSGCMSGCGEELTYKPTPKDPYAIGAYSITPTYKPLDMASSGPFDMLVDMNRQTIDMGPDMSTCEEPGRVSFKVDSGLYYDSKLKALCNWDKIKDSKGCFRCLLHDMEAFSLISFSSSSPDINYYKDNKCTEKVALVIGSMSTTLVIGHTTYYPGMDILNKYGAGVVKTDTGKAFMKYDKVVLEKPYYNNGKECVEQDIKMFAVNPTLISLLDLAGR